MRYERFSAWRSPRSSTAAPLSLPASPDRAFLYRAGHRVVAAQTFACLLSICSKRFVYKCCSSQIDEYKRHEIILNSLG